MFSVTEKTKMKPILLYNINNILNVMVLLAIGLFKLWICVHVQLNIEKTRWLSRDFLVFMESTSGYIMLFKGIPFE